MNGFEIKVRKMQQKIYKKNKPNRHNAHVPAAICVMFNFTLPGRNKILYANPHLKKLRIVNLNEHAVPVQYPAEQQPPNTQPTKIKSPERFYKILFPEGTLSF